MTRILAQIFHAGKSASALTEWEDGAAYSERRRCFAVTDGAASAFRSRDWAESLAEAFSVSYPVMSRRTGANRNPAIREWFVAQAARWPAVGGAPGGDSGSHWWEEHKARTEGPAAAFIGLCLGQPTPGERNLSWEAVSIGDCCVFHVHDSRLITSFPYTSAEMFNNHPALFPAAVTQAEKAANAAKIVRGTATRGDRFILASDAFSQWLLSYHGSDPSTWRRLDSLDHVTYGALVADLTRARLMVDDDSTVMIVRLT